jgi:O-antigen/teichoic acid export membrane protein
MEAATKGTMTLARGSALLISAVAIAGVLRYVFNISMGWLLSPDEFGILGIALAIISILSLLLTAAFPWATAKFTSEPGQRVHPFKSSVLANLIFAILLCFLLYGLFALVILDQEYQSILIVIIVFTLIASIGAVYHGALQGLFRFKQLAVIRIVDLLAVVVCAIPLVLLGLGVLGAVMGFLASAVITTLLALYYTRDQRFLRSGSWIDRDVYAYSLPLFLGCVGAYLMMNVDIFGVKFFIGGEADVMAGYYQASLTLARLPLFIMTGAVMAAFFPFISQYSTDKEKVERYVTKVIKYALIFILPISLVLIVLSGQIIGLVFPQSYVVGARALSILSIGMFFLVFILTFSRTFQAINKPKIPAFILSGAITLQILLLYFLVPKYGLTGAAISTTIASIAGFIALSLEYIRYYKLRLKATDLLRIAVSSCILILFLLLFPVGNIALLILGIALGLIVFLVILAALGVLTHEDVDILLSGMFGRENRFRAKVVGLIKGLNMATSERKSPRLRTAERYLPFLLGIAAFVSAIFIPSEVAVAAIFAFTLVIYALRRYNSNILIVAAITLLILGAILFAWWGEAMANQVAIPAFYLLAIGVIGVLIDFIWQRKERVKAGDE